MSDEFDPEAYVSGDYESASPVDLADVRSSLVSELDNPPTAFQLYSVIQREVGGQGAKDQQGFIESVFNRAATRGQSLSYTINDRHYYPAISLNPVETVGDTKEYHQALSNVVGGSNITNYATGNASGKVGFN